MTVGSHVEPLWKIVPACSDLRKEMLEDALRTKTMQIREQRAVKEQGMPALDKAAEAETLQPLDCGLLLSENEIELTTDAGCFQEGDIALCTEPHRLTLWGHRAAPANCPVSTDQTNNPHCLIFRFVNLPFEIDPSKVTTRRNGRVLTMNLPRRLAAGG